MRYSAEERVKKGIRYLDSAVGYGKVSPFWRNSINLKELRIDNCNKSIPSLIFNVPWQEAKSRIGLFGYYAGAALGFQHYPSPYRDSTASLRRAWENALKTDPNWKCINQSYPIYRRTINGVTYFITPDSFNGLPVITYTLAGKYYQSKPYRNIESAKRAVRKLAVKTF